MNAMQLLNVALSDSITYIMKLRDVKYSNPASKWKISTWIWNKSLWVWTEFVCKQTQQRAALSFFTLWELIDSVPLLVNKPHD